MKIASVALLVWLGDVVNGFSFPSLILGGNGGSIEQVIPFAGPAVQGFDRLVQTYNDVVAAPASSAAVEAAGGGGGTTSITGNYLDALSWTADPVLASSWNVLPANVDMYLTDLTSLAAASAHSNPDDYFNTLSHTFASSSTVLGDASASTAAANNVAAAAAPSAQTAATTAAAATAAKPTVVASTTAAATAAPVVKPAVVATTTAAAAPAAPVVNAAATAAVAPVVKVAPPVMAAAATAPPATTMAAAAPAVKVAAPAAAAATVAAATPAAPPAATTMAAAAAAPAVKVAAPVATAAAPVVKAAVAAPAAAMATAAPVVKAAAPVAAAAAAPVVKAAVATNAAAAAAAAAPVVKAAAVSSAPAAAAAAMAAVATNPPPPMPPNNNMMNAFPAFINKAAMIMGTDHPVQPRNFDISHPEQLSIADFADTTINAIQRIGNGVYQVLDATAHEPTIAWLGNKAQTAVATLVDSATHAVMVKVSQVGNDISHMEVQQLITTVVQMFVTVVNILYTIINSIITVATGQSTSEWAMAAGHALEKESGVLLAQASAFATDVSHASLIELASRIDHLSTDIVNLVAQSVGSSGTILANGIF